MEFYNVHTHDAVPQTDEGESSHPYILNVYPLGFEDAKDSSLGCFFSCGVHPWYSEDAAPQLNFLREIASDNRIIAIGEVGYDRLKGPGMQVQSHVFENQAKLSESLKKPLIIHCVKAWEELLASYKKIAPKQPWIIHGYRGKPELTRQLSDHGFLFSIHDKFNKDSIQEIPLNSLLCETDVYDIEIEEVYRIVAEALELPLQEFTGIIEENVKRVFPQLIPVNIL